MPIISLQNLLKSDPDSALDKIVQTAQGMEELTVGIRAELEPELAQNLLAASVNQDQLVLIASTSAWASKLRFEADRLIACACKMGVPVKGCRVSVSRSALPGRNPGDGPTR